MVFWKQSRKQVDTKLEPETSSYLVHTAVRSQNIIDEYVMQSEQQYSTC